MGKKKVETVSSKRQFINLVDKMVKRHGQIRIVSHEQDHYNDSPIKACSCMCESCLKTIDTQTGKRKRWIKKDGTCRVSYKGAGYKTWSGFSESCFMDNYSDDRDVYCKKCDSYSSWGCDCGYVEKELNKPLKLEVKKTVKYLLEHDVGPHGEDIKPFAIEYGKRFSKVKRIKTKF